MSVVAVETPPNLAREPFDVTLFFGEGPPQPDQIVLFQDRIFPVCAPDIARRLGSVADLENETLLHDTTWTDDWALWLSQFPDAPRSGHRGPVYSLFAVALEEACNGAGVLMAHEALVATRLRTGALVAPFDQHLTLDRSLRMGIAPSFRNKPACAVLRQVMEGAS